MADVEEIKKKLAEFEAGLKPVKPGVTTLKAEAIEEEAPQAVEPVAAEGAPACITKEFKHLVGALGAAYVGINTKDFVLELLEQVPECEVAA